METECGNVECEREATHLIEFSLIGEGKKASMKLCEPCWCKLIDNMGVQSVNRAVAE